MKLNFTHRQPHLYLEHARLLVGGGSLLFEQKGRKHPIPINCYTHLLLGPGTSVTHEALRVCTKAGTSILWVGSEGTQVWTGTMPRYESSDALLRQVSCHMHERRKRKVARHLFHKRYGVKVSPDVEIPGIRGMEGARCRKLYRELSERYGVPWTKRVPVARLKEGEEGDAINRMIDAGNGCIIGAAMAAVSIAGFTPALGFLHQGFSRAFACDIADLHKFKYGVETAFQLHSQGCRDPREVRLATREHMQATGLLTRMVKDAQEAVDAGIRR